MNIVNGLIYTGEVELSISGKKIVIKNKPTEDFLKSICMYIIGKPSEYPYYIDILRSVGGDSSTSILKHDLTNGKGVIIRRKKVLTAKDSTDNDKIFDYTASLHTVIDYSYYELGKVPQNGDFIVLKSLNGVELAKVTLSGLNQGFDAYTNLILTWRIRINNYEETTQTIQTPETNNNLEE